MYFIFVSSDSDAVTLLQQEMSVVNPDDILRTVQNGFDLILFLENIKRGEAYPDLIILTKKMARLSGHEILELLKTDDIYRLIPVIMLVPEHNDEDYFFCNSMGAEMMTIPKFRNEWATAARKFSEACS